MNPPTTGPAAGAEIGEVIAQYNDAMTAAAATAAPAPAAAQFTERDWRHVRRLMASVPYSGGMQTAPDLAPTPETLIRWLTDLAERLEIHAANVGRMEVSLTEATRVINAGRLAFATLTQAPGTPIGPGA